MLVSSESLFDNALKQGYAIGAYNINNLEWTKYILEACQEDRCPVILAVSESAATYMGGFKVVYNMVKSLIKELNIKIPVVLHLDHGKSLDTCKKAIDAGFTSVMLDDSSKSLDINIDETCELLEYASNYNVSVEAELGSLSGIEDEIESRALYTSLDEAKEFVISTGVKSLAPAFGNQHGPYKGEPKLDFDLLGSICREVKIPLVLHGASGLDENKLKTAIFCGVTKININTDIQIAWSRAIREYLLNNKNVYDPRKIIGAGEKAIKKVVHEKNSIFGVKNRAN